MDDTLYCREADAKTGKFGFRMKSLERVKQSFCIRHTEPRTIIPDEIGILPIDLR
jgi:hypothetical protein